MSRKPTFDDVEAARWRYWNAPHGKRIEARIRLVDTMNAVLRQEVRQTRRASRQAQERIDSLENRS